MHEGGYPKNFIWLEYDLKFTDSLLVKATMTSPTQKNIEDLIGSAAQSWTDFYERSTWQGEKLGSYDLDDRDQPIDKID